MNYQKQNHSSPQTKTITSDVKSVPLKDEIDENKTEDSPKKKRRAKKLPSFVSEKDLVARGSQNMENKIKELKSVLENFFRRYRDLDSEPDMKWDKIEILNKEIDEIFKEELK